MARAQLWNVGATLPVAAAGSFYPAYEGNTGYQNAGQLAGWSGTGHGAYSSSDLANGNSLSLADNTTYTLKNFDGGTGPALGTSSFASGSSAVNITFIGCRFASNNTADANVNTVGSNIAYKYCTFEPNTVAAGSEPAISNNTYQIAGASAFQYGINNNNGGIPITMDHCRMWGYANAVQINASTQASPFTITNSLFQNPRNPSLGDHTDGPGILNNSFSGSYLVISGCTIIGLGNTNAIALQGGVSFDHFTVTNNYVAGYGFTCFLGTVGFAGQATTNFTFTGNTWGSDANLEPAGGPVYTSFTPFGSGDFTAHGNFWQNNKISTAAGTTWMAAGNNGLFWWPSDGNPAGSSSIVGHASDYANS